MSNFSNAEKVIGIGETDILYFGLPGDFPFMAIVPSSIDADTDLSQRTEIPAQFHVRTISFRFSDSQTNLLFATSN